MLVRPFLNEIDMWFLILIWVVVCLFGELTGGRGFGNGNISWESPVVVDSLELEAYGETVDGGNVIGNISYMLVK